MKKIVQTAGRDSLGEFAKEIAHFNDDVLFGENWNNEDIDLKIRCIDIVELKPGDYINILPGVKHWHGAAKDSWLSHLATEVLGDNSSTEWLDKVNDEEYDKLK